MTSLITRSLCYAVVVATALLPAHPAAAQMRDSETPAPRTWPVVLAQSLTNIGAALLQEVSAAVDLLPEQITTTRRVQTDDAEASPPATAHREIDMALTAAQLGRLR